MKIVIDIPDGAYEELCNAKFPIQDAYRLVAWIKDGTPLPDNVTNGDVIKAICPAWINYHNTDVELIIDYKDWNATYKLEDIKKTGRYFDNITEVLKQLKGENNDFESKDNREKGEWIIMGGGYIKCNKCDRLIKTESPDCYFYCPRCGRKMIEHTEGLV